MVRFAFMAGVIDRDDTFSVPPQQDTWPSVLAAAIRDPAELCRLLGLDQSFATGAGPAAADFPLLVPRTFVDRIRPGDPTDPLLRQVLPRRCELADVAGYLPDPLHEGAAARAPGLLQKYAGRSLILATRHCGVHCRYCFRRHFPQASSPHKSENWRPALRRIAADESIREVILSGGDPLTLPDSSLSRLAMRLADIPHVRRLRVHSRMPVVIPQRVTGELLAWLRDTRLSTLIVVQVNHPAEIDEAVAAALGRLVEAGVPVLCQSVLLRGINDSPDVLAELCERLIDLRVMPYYLHQLDRVAGAAHFEVPEATGIGLIEQLRARLPGYAVPRYVRETPAAPGKVVLA